MANVTVKASLWLVLVAMVGLVMRVESSIIDGAPDSFDPSSPPEPCTLVIPPTSSINDALRSRALGLAHLPSLVLCLQAGLYSGCDKGPALVTVPNHRVTVRGQGSEHTVIDCDGDGRFLTHTMGLLSLEGLTIKNGDSRTLDEPEGERGGGCLRLGQWSPEDESGGGLGDENLIPRPRVWVNLVDVLLQGCLSEESGGAILAFASSLALRQSSIIGCSGHAGGAIAMMGGELGVSLSVLEGNTGVEGGGAVYLSRSRSSFANSTILLNTGGLGGGVVLSTAGLEMTSCEVQGNLATRGYGGGLYVSEDAVAHLLYSSLSGNTALYNSGGGGGGGGGGEARKGETQAEGEDGGEDEEEGSWASGGGGVCVADETGMLEIENCLLADNIGGAVALGQGFVGMRSTAVCGNTLPQIVCGDGLAYVHGIGGGGGAGEAGGAPGDNEGCAYGPRECCTDMTGVRVGRTGDFRCEVCVCGFVYDSVRGACVMVDGGERVVDCSEDEEEEEEEDGIIVNEEANEPPCLHDEL